MPPSIKDMLAFDIRGLFGAKGQVLGLDIGSRAIKLVQLKEVKGRYVLEKFGLKPLEPEVIVDGTVMDENRVVAAIKELLSETGAKLKNVAISISGHSVIVKKISLPPMPEDEMEGQVKLAAEQYIPFDINEVNFDFHILNPMDQADDGEPQMTLLLVAAKKDKVNELTELVKGAGLNPVVMDVDAFAIENMYGINYEESPDEITALVNMGASVMNVNILKGGTSVFTRDIPIGGNRYTEAIQRELGMSYDEAEAAKKGKHHAVTGSGSVSSVIDGVNAEVASEIARTVDYFRTTGSEGEIGKVLLCGGACKIEGFGQLLSDRMHCPVEFANPFNQVDTSSADVDPETLSEFAAEAAVGVGLALRAVGDR